MFTDNSTSREILTSTNLAYCKAENGLSFNSFVNWRYIWRPYNLLQIKMCWCCPACQLCGYKCDMQILKDSCLQVPPNCKLQHINTTLLINGFERMPGFFISALYLLCQKGEDAAKAFFLEDKTHIKNALLLLAVHTTCFSQIRLKMPADRSNL